MSAAFCRVKIISGIVPPRRTLTRAGAGAGFTLLEIVLALTIFGLLTLMAYSAFDVGHRAVLKGERAADINQRMRIAADIISRQLHSAIFYFAKDDEDSSPYFLGTAEGMSFVTAAPQSHNGQGLAVVTYRVVDGELVIEERISFSRDNLWESRDNFEVQRSVLFSGFSALHFEYLQHEEEADAWQPTWDGREHEGMPAAVRITVEGLEFFNFSPWVQSIPLMTVAGGSGTDEAQEPPDEEEDDAAGTTEFGDKPNTGFRNKANERDAE